ncbi:tryptophan-rich sensory protein [Micromonospora profundi]|uniref:tryptophan-rich sensory protein n=1 Tax=Micromonospora profundi TaxID=1420889 RepID=UPI0016AF0EAF|nr:tryptophan-rich sensory protein [Micromonospora profundi]NJC14888.1 tryptophan-rich sensory protein [Micromonospora profundi]
MKDLCIETYPEPTFRRSAGGDSSDMALFFGARKLAAALAEIAALNASNLVLLGRAARADRLAGAALAPYAAWTLFATVLNGTIVGLNRGR